jgi:hypothetical protein
MSIMKKFKISTKQMIFIILNLREEILIISEDLTKEVVQESITIILTKEEALIILEAIEITDIILINANIIKIKTKIMINNSTILRVIYKSLMKKKNIKDIKNRTNIMKISIKQGEVVQIEHNTEEEVIISIEIMRDIRKVINTEEAIEGNITTILEEAEEIINRIMKMRRLIINLIMKKINRIKIVKMKVQSRLLNNNKSSLITK